MPLPLIVPAAGPWIWPVATAAVTDAYLAPSSRWGPGHRGIDLEAPVGQVVTAVAGGRVRFVGVIAGVPTVSIDHGTVRSTYQPVAASVTEGDVVGAGQPLGRVEGRLPHCPVACLHLGAKVTGGYLDPVTLIVGGAVILKPVGAPG